MAQAGQEVTVSEALDFIRACRDTHLPFANGEVTPDLRATDEVDYGPGGEQAFHAQCVRDYDEALTALEALQRRHAGLLRNSRARA